MRRMRRRRRKCKQYNVITEHDFKSLMLKEECNRIEVWSDEKKQYKRFDFVGWEDRTEEARA